MAFKMNIVFAVVLCFQALNLAIAKPSSGCGCEGYGGYGGGFSGGYGTDLGAGCGPVSPPISFVPVPQPCPIRVPQPQAPKQSVTIPNIILALLPPTAPIQKPPCAPKPIARPCPQPIVVPVPQPFPCPVPC